MSLVNFKAFKDSGTVDLKKINVFLGQNSSGKSSFLKALLILKNTLHENDNNTALYLNNDTGPFGSILYGKSDKPHITFEMGFDDNEKISEFRDVLNDKTFITLMLVRMKKNIKTFNEYEEVAKKEFVNYTKNSIKTVKVTFKETQKKPSTVEEFELTFSNKDTCRIYMERNAYYIQYNDFNFKNKPNLLLPNKFLFDFNLTKTHNINDHDADMLFKILLAIKEVEVKLQNFAKRVIHIEPFRDKPERLKLITNFKFNSVGSRGENTISTLIGLDNESNTNSKRSNVTIKKSMNKWLNEFDLAETIEVEESKNNQYLLTVTNKYTGIKCNIADVGVGTSQLLPIIIESINTPNDTVLFIEEPETHIHPNAQAKLGQLFVDCALKQNKSFFIETHSMYLVKQLQISVAKGDIKADDVGIYYFQQSSEGTNIKNLKLQGNGQFAEEIPKGFFDVPFNLSNELRKYL